MNASRFFVTLITISIASGFALGGCSKTIDDTDPSLQTTVRVSIATGDVEGNSDAVNDQLAVSNDGRFVAFTSKATNLVAGDTNNVTDIFLRDNRTRTLILISISLVGGASNGASGSPAVSGDGNYVVFTSLATNLTPDVVPAGVRQVYVRDVAAGTTTLVSRATGVASLIATADCVNPRISFDGSSVAFDTIANNLDGVPGGGDDNDAFQDIYVRRWLDAANNFPTWVVSFSSGATGVADPAIPPGPAGPKANNSCFKPCLSQTGRYIAFESSATNLVTASADGGPDQNNFTDVFVRDTQTFRTVRCSVELTGTIFPNALAGPSTSASISLDGLLVAFRSTSGLLSVLAQETVPNVFVRSWFAVLPDLPFTEVLSVHTSGATGGQNCDRPTISGDGNRIAWQSPSPALVNGDSNSVLDIFMRDRALQATTRQSVQTFGGQLDGQSGAPAYSGDGRYIVFWTQATNGVDDDTNGAADIYMRGPPFK